MIDYHVLFRNMCDITKLIYKVVLCFFVNGILKSNSIWIWSRFNGCEICSETSKWCHKSLSFSHTAINSHACLFYRWVWNPTACGQFSYRLSVMVGRAFSRFKLQTCETPSASTNESKIFISSVHPETGWTPCSSSVSNSSHFALVTAVNSEQLPLNVYLDSDFFRGGVHLLQEWWPERRSLLSLLLRSFLTSF